MTNGATFNYKNGRKNQWRRTTWNAICDRLEILGVPRKDAIVLYLAGERDLDRGVALSKGFNRHNLIAVERDRDCFKTLRGNGVLTVNGTLLDVVRNWGETQVHVVFADMCSGLTKENALTAFLLPYLSAFKKCVCMFNLMAGREHWENTKLNGLNRAKALHMTIGTAVMSPQAMSLTTGLIEQFEKITKPHFYSYLSVTDNASLRFDSVTMIVPRPKMVRDVRYLDKVFTANTSLRNRIAAIKATRTRILNA